MVDSRERKKNDEDDTGRNGWLVAIEVVGVHLPLLDSRVAQVLKVFSQCWDRGGPRAYIHFTVTSATPSAANIGYSAVPLDPGYYLTYKPKAFIEG